MPITVVFDPPLPSDSPEVFNSKAFSTLGDLNDWSTEANALASDVTAKQTTASNAATTATTQAGIATSAASTASTKASEAVNARDVAVQAASDAEDAAAAAALFDPANYVAKAGSTMTGPLSVPAGASGAQVPQAQEVAGIVAPTIPAAVKSTLNASGDAPVYACRAWVNFNGTGTVAIRASGNVSSITDNGTGDYTVNFTTAMPDANYSVSGSAGRNADVNNMFATNLTTYTTAAVRVGTLAAGSTPTNADMGAVCVAIFR